MLGGDPCNFGGKLRGRPRPKPRKSRRHPALPSAHHLRSPSPFPLGSEATAETVCHARQNCHAAAATACRYPSLWPSTIALCVAFVGQGPSRHWTPPSSPPSPSARPIYREIYLPPGPRTADRVIAPVAVSRPRTAQCLPRPRIPGRRKGYSNNPLLIARSACVTSLVLCSRASADSLVTSRHFFQPRLVARLACYLPLPRALDEPAALSGRLCGTH